MSKQILIVSEEVKQDIQRVIDHAKKNVTTAEDVAQILAGKKRPVGDLPEFSVNIPKGFRVVFSFEQQPSGLVAHLSTSHENKDTLPNPHHVKEILKLFGFQNPIEDCQIWFEETGDEVTAVNIAELRNEAVPEER